MKRIFLFTAFVISTVSIYAQQTIQQLSEKVKVTFPVKPLETKAGTGATVYTASTADSSKSYSALGFDLSAMGLNADIIQSMGDALWDQMKGGMVAQMGGANVLKSEIVQFKGKSSYFMEIDGANSTAAELKGKKAFSYFFFIGSILHQVAYYAKDPAAKVTDAQSFFDSVEIAQ